MFKARYAFFGKKVPEGRMMVGLVSSRWSVVGSRGAFGSRGSWQAGASVDGSEDYAQDDETGAAEEAAGAFMASADGSEGYAQDDGGEDDCGVSRHAYRYR